MAHPVHPAVLAQQRAGCDANLDLGVGDPGGSKVDATHHAMRPRGQPRKFLLHRPVLWSHEDQ